MGRAILTRVATIVASGAAIAAIVIPGIAATEVASPPAKAHGTSRTEIPVKAGKKYVALGSSYAAGPDVSPIVDVPCLRTGNDYPHQVAAAARMRLTDASCSGATSANVFTKPQRPATVPQIDAVTRDTYLVTITVGGNDIDYIGRVTSLSCGNILPAHAGFAKCGHRRHIRPEPGPAAYAAVEKSLTGLIRAVRARAPHARILVVDYLPVLDARATVCAKVPLTPAEAAQTVRVAGGLARATAAAVRATGAQLVRASKAGAAHTVCSPQPWLYGFKFPAPYHPNPSGKAAVARLVLDALRTPPSQVS
ncbi:SGNH/GDSL hydrolase family protein [Gordonia sp. CPCC 206044]|uniref:SGNH/GDSL hydrolase family protein n=1 Tax=Gordonia sp. CPCC 206044 TaxID=3140793 RepID=UPI003AF3ED9C